MTLQTSGAISISQINAEFGRGNSLSAYRGTGWFTDAGGSGNFSTGAISMSDFYGKRLTSPQFNVTVSSSQTNFNLRTYAVNQGWNQSSKLVVQINSGVYIRSNNATTSWSGPGTGTPAMTISGSFPNGVELKNYGFILGMGGRGGNGGGRDANGQVGYVGGQAIYVSTAVSIRNAGTIAGGGGGGGGGRGVYSEYNSGGGGGGGGGRSSGAANSAGGTGNTYGKDGSNGASGTLSNYGNGGAGGGDGYAGGRGGTWGSSGVAGGSSSAGGLGGYAVNGNGYVTWLQTGTRYGGLG